MRILVAAALVATVLAGCASSPDPSVDEVEETIASLNTWVTDVTGQLDVSAWNGTLPEMELVVFTDRVSGEPTLGVTRTGSLWYASIDWDSPMPNGGPRTFFYRSLDNGTTWDVRNPHMAGVETHPQSGDPYVYVDPTTSRVFALDMGPSVACNKVSWSDDDGESWVTRDLACPFPVADHPTLFAGPAPLGAESPLYPNWVYICNNQVVQAKCAYSPDGGITWGETGLIYEGVRPARGEGTLPQICSGFTSHGHVSWTDGTMYVPRAWCEEPYMAVSYDGGLTFERQSLGTDEQYFTRGEHDVMVSTDRSGTAYAFWIGGAGTTAYLSVSADQGATWSTPINVTAPGVTAAKMPGIVAGEDGRIAFMYIGTETPSGWDLSSMENDADEVKNATWNAYVGFSLNADEANPIVAHTTVNPLDQPIKRGKCEDRCFGTTGGLYDFLDIDIDPMTGAVYLALVDICTGDCDQPGADATIDQFSKGAIGRMVAGPRLLDAPIEAREAAVSLF